MSFHPGIVLTLLHAPNRRWFYCWCSVNQYIRSFRLVLRVFVHLRLNLDHFRTRWRPAPACASLLSLNQLLETRRCPLTAQEVNTNDESLEVQNHHFCKPSSSVMNVSKTLKSGGMADVAAPIPGRKRRPTSWRASVVSLVQQMLSSVQMIQLVSTTSPHKTNIWHMRLFSSNNTATFGRQSQQRIKFMISVCVLILKHLEYHLLGVPADVPCELSGEGGVRASSPGAKCSSGFFAPADWRTNVQGAERRQREGGAGVERLPAEFRRPGRTHGKMLVFRLELTRSGLTLIWKFRGEEL